MFLKELKNSVDGKNLFDFIDYFKGMENTKPYYTELILKYGNKQLLDTISELNSDNEGLEVIGAIFILKSKDWKNSDTVNDKIKQLSLEDKKITTNTNDTENVTKNHVNNENKTNTENVIPYDSNSELEVNSVSDVNSYNGNETLEDRKTGTSETIHSGYDIERLHYLEMFKTTPDYRYMIYDDIVNTLCLKIY